MMVVVFINSEGTTKNRLLVLPKAISIITASIQAAEVKAKNILRESSCRHKDIADVKNIGIRIFILTSNEDNEKLFNKYDGTKNTKALAAKEFMDKVFNGDISPSEETCENFKNLFLALGINVK